MEANYFTILYWFCHTSTWIRHGCTHVPHPELLPPPSPYHPSGSSQCISPKHPVSCIEPGLAIRFIYDIIHVSFFFILFFKLYIIVLVLPNIKMNPPQVYMCSPSWTPPSHSPYHPSGSSQCISPKHPVSCIKPGLAIHFLYDVFKSYIFS